MRTQTLNVETMLHAAFLKAELDFLKSTPQFRKALPLVKTESQFERMCALSEELLGRYHRAHPSARQFRESFVSPASAPRA